MRVPDNTHGNRCALRALIQHLHFGVVATERWKRSLDDFLVATHDKLLSASAAEREGRGMFETRSAAQDASAIISACFKWQALINCARVVY